MDGGFVVVFHCSKGTIKQTGKTIQESVDNEWPCGRMTTSTIICGRMQSSRIDPKTYKNLVHHNVASQSGGGVKTNLGQRGSHLENVLSPTLYTRNQDKLQELNIK